MIATKAGITRTPEGRIVDASRGALLRRLDESLRKLGTDYIDLWYVHYIDDTVPFEETLAALDHAVASGKVRYVGVSNYCGWRLGPGRAWQQAVPGRAPIVADQVRYSLLDRGIEREVVPACAALGVGVMPYSPLGGGVLTGKYRDGVPADSRAAATRPLPLDERPGALGIVEAVATAAEGLATSPVVGGAGVAARPSRGRRADPGRAHPRPAHRRPGERGAGAASRDRRRARRRLRAHGRLPGGRALSSPDPVFAAFCAAGLWPGLGRRLAETLAESGITGPGRRHGGEPAGPAAGQPAARRAAAVVVHRGRPGLRGRVTRRPERAGRPGGRARRRPARPAPRRGCCATTRGGCWRCPA